MTHITEGFDLGPIVSACLIPAMSKISPVPTNNRYSPGIRIARMNYSINEETMQSALYVGSSGQWSILVDLAAEPHSSSSRFSATNITGAIASLGSPGLGVQGSDASMTIYYGDRGLSVGIERDGIREGTNGFRTNDSTITYRKEEQEHLCELDSALFVDFKSTQHFKNWINSCRKSRNGRMICSSTDAVAQCQFPGLEEKELLNDVKGVTSVAITGEPVIGLFDYNNVYPFLWGRKSTDGGLLTYYDNNDIRYTVDGVGITSYGCVYFQITASDTTIYLICPRSIHSDDSFGDMPDNPNRTTTTTEVPQITEEDTPVEELQGVLPVVVEFTEEQAERLLLWEAAHSTFCDRRNRTVSTSRKLWFGHYVMALSVDGREPDELDDSIISLL